MTTDLPESRWWLPIALLVIAVAIQTLSVAVLPPDVFSQLPLVPLVLAGGVLQVGSPAWVYLDRRYVTAVSDWEPSGWYYFMVLPPLPVLLAPLYLYRRHQYLGVP